MEILATPARPAAAARLWRAALPVGIALVALASAACQRAPDKLDARDAGPRPPSSAAPDDSASAAPDDPDPDEIAPPSPDETPRRPLSSSEAHRFTLARLEDDRSLVLQRAVIAAHFGGKIPSPLEVQTATLGGGHRAVLLSGPPKDRRPIILVLDDRGGVRWTKERPLAGIAPGVSEIVLLPGPDAEVRIAWFDAPTHLVAMRAWDATGGILADFRLLEVEAATALSGLYWPGRGFVIIASEERAQAQATLLDEGGKLAWGSEGRPIPWVSRAGAPVTLALDTDSSVMVLGTGDVEAQDHAFAARLDAHGSPIWPRPLDLGAVPRPPAGAAAPRITADRGPNGGVHATLPKGSAKRILDITSDGIVTAPAPR